MKNRNFVIALILTIMSGAFGIRTNAQGSFAPQAGDKMVSLKIGRLIDYGEVSAYYVNSSASSSTTYIGYPTMSTDDASTTISIIGVEAKYFINSKMAIRLGGGGAVAAAPSQDYVDGVSVSGSTYSSSSIPSYAMLEGKTTMEMYGDLGLDYYFTTKVNRLFPFIGLEGSGVYGQMEIWDGYSGLDGDDEVIATYDTRRGEAYAFGGGLNGGVDYYLAEGLFFGVEVNIASYMYSVKTIFPQTGMDPIESMAHNLSFLSQPIIKLGFKF